MTFVRYFVVLIIASIVIFWIMTALGYTYVG
jgi:hypothetical protein